MFLAFNKGGQQRYYIDSGNFFSQEQVVAYDICVLMIPSKILIPSILFLLKKANTYDMILMNIGCKKYFKI